MQNVDTPYKSRKVLYHTFGCKLNFAETASLQSQLESRGYVTVNKTEIPDIVVINTCSVTEVADKKCRRYIRTVHRSYPEASIVVTGCYAQLKSDEVSKLGGVRIVAGTENKGRLPELIGSLVDDSHAVCVSETEQIETFVPSCARGDRTRYFLKVQDGCDYRCSYCTIPKARGRSRSPFIRQLVEQAEKVAADGGREIVITGVNIGDFGRYQPAAGDAHKPETFLELLKALDKVEGIERYRISSVEPNLLTDEIIEFCAGSRRFMPHFHIPLQSGSDTVLGLMRRRYKTELFRHRIEKIRQVIPDAFIGVDLIVGSRGETPELFAESKAFVESLDISRLHVFAYSERPGTDALKIPYKVSSAEQSARVAEMLAVSDSKLADFSKRYIGKVRDVLIEHGTHEDSAFSDNSVGGFTDNYLRVKVDGAESFDNRIVPVFLERLDESGRFIHGKIRL